VRKVDKIKVGYATVAKKVDVRRLKKDLWSELEATFAPPPADANKKDDSMDEEDNSAADATETPAPAANEPKVLSFQKTVSDMEAKQSQGDVTVPFYFICLLHLANEKGLRLESTGLEDFVIQTEDGSAPSFGTLPNETATGESSIHRAKRTKEVTMYVDSESDTDAEEEGDETDSDSE
jgi:condensin complex subunit 2